MKLGAYLMSGSVALLSDALESIINILASLLMFFSVYISGMPADEDHHYGHQRIEYISSLVEGFLIIIAAIFIIHTALERISQPVTLTSIETALGVSLFATVMNGGLSWHLSRTARDAGSMALEGDAKHLLSDVVTSVGVVVGLWVAQITGWNLMDPVIALVVSTLVLKMGLDLVLKSGGGLMDDHVPEVEEKLMTLLEHHKSRFVDFHNIKTRKSGNHIFAELHLSMDASLTVQEAHDFTDHLEEDIKKEMPEVTLTIHIEPQRSEN
ncbi:cation diffusion facilitator family transporter [Thermoproteota archaeon]